MTDQFQSPNFVSWDEVFGESEISKYCCAITSCDVFACTAAGCGSGYQGIAWTESGASPGNIYIEDGTFKLKAKYSTIPYSEEFKITCTNSGGSADLTGLVVSQTSECSNTLTSNPGVSFSNILFDFDSSSTSYDVSADFTSIHY